MQRRAAAPAIALLMALLMAAVAPAHASDAPADAYDVILEPSLADEPVSGRLILFFITGDEPRWRRREPMAAPFFGKPQPIASIEVVAMAPGDRVTVDAGAVAFPRPLDELDGPVRVQALLDVDHTERSHEQGPGNLFSDVVSTDVSPDRADRIELTLRHRVEAEPAPRDDDTIEWIRVRSEMLSDFYGRDVLHRAAVVLPAGYRADPPPRSTWPAIYVIPGFGGRDGMASRRARALRRASDLPEAVWVFLDPESPLGHHGFVDSPGNGMRGTALVRELIPLLDERFALEPTPAGRIVTGHSSGAWSALWLQLRWPDVFGGCWCSAPDPVDFSAFQASDLYRDESLYVDAEGRPVPSMRRLDGGRDVVVMTVEQECGMEHAIDPRGGSGQQWDAWEAMFSPLDPATGMPRPMFDAGTGKIDRAVVERWSRYDVTRLLQEQWERLGPIMLDRVRLVCGTQDSFYLDRAVRRLAETVDRLAWAERLDARQGYVELIEGATHGSVRAAVQRRWNEEMKAHLRERGLHP